MVTTGESFRLRWNDFGNNFMGSVRQLREDDDFIDVSLVTSDSGNKVLEGHKVVLAACSNFFKEILRRQSR
jgi:BTB/POZ domain